jgi:predicted RNase H-like HicB family nuclease/predicted RNA binding protein YcfA (HicA-like mRNA interferase family)
MQNKYYKISIFVKEEEGVYYAYCSELSGCHSQGDTYDEVKENIQEAVDLYLETFSEQEAMECLGKPLIEEASNSSFDIQLRLTSAQAEKLLLNAGFSLAGSKDKHRIYLKKNLRFILPLLAGKNLSQKMAKEILDLVGV